MWVHFEPYHENFEPTYMPKYPPAQSLFLALGQRFLGHPWYGVLLSFGLMWDACAVRGRGWIPPL